MYIRIGMNPFSALAFALTAGTALVAQTTTGSLNGIVKEAKGGPLAGVRVTISSPDLIAPRIVTTNSQGEWRAPLLPPGTYKIQTDLEGYLGAEAVGMRLGIGTSLRQDLSMKKKEEAGAVVEVVETAGTVDKSDTKTASNFSSEQLEVLAGNGRSFSGAADLAPGVVSGAGGTFSIRGGATQQTQYRVNGTDTKDDYQGAQVGTYVIDDNIEDVQVVLSPLHARNGRATGGAINVVTKSGGNDFQGSFRASFSRPSWTARTPADLFLEGSTVDDATRQFDIVISGPIIKERLWFNVGSILRPSESSNLTLGSDANSRGLTNQRVVNTINNVNIYWWPELDQAIKAGPSGGIAGQWPNSVYGPGWAMETFNNPLNYIMKSDNAYYEYKLTAALTADHTIEVSGTSDKTVLNNRFHISGARPARLEVLGRQESSQGLMGINYRGVLGSATFVTASYNRKLVSVVFPTGDPIGAGEAVNVVYDRPNPYAHTWLVQGLPFGLGYTSRPQERNSTSGNVELKLFRDLFNGSHEIDLGLDYYQYDFVTSASVGLKNRRFYVGGAYYNPTSRQYLFPAIIWTGVNRWGQNSSGLAGPAPVMMQYTGRDGTRKNGMKAPYFNDAWTINSHWNLMLGLRQDMLTVTDTDGTEKGKASALSPRMSLKYDINGDSRHILTLNAARFGGDFSDGFTRVFCSDAASELYYQGFSGLPGQESPDTAGFVDQALRFLTYAQLTDPANYTTTFNYSNSKLNSRIIGDLTSEKLDEITLGYRRGASDGSYVSMTYVHRQWRDQWAFRVDWDDANTVAFGNGNSRIMQTLVFNSNELIRQLNSLEIDFQTKFNPTWSFSGNLTLSHLVGNNQGGDSSSSFRDNGVPGYYFYRNFLMTQRGRTNDDIAPVGPLMNDTPIRARINLSAHLPLGKGFISYAWLLSYESGTPWSAVQTALIDPDKKLPNIPNLLTSKPQSYSQFYGGRGQYTTNDTYTVDFKMAWSVPLGIGKLQMMGDIKVNNLFNSIIQAGYSTATETTTGQDYFGLDTTVFGTDRRGTGAAYWVGRRTIGISLGLKF